MIFVHFLTNTVNFVVNVSKLKPPFVVLPHQIFLYNCGFWFAISKPRISSQLSRKICVSI